jgi:hypothetical protein
VSVQALSWVLEHSEARLADRLVLLSLADHAKADGTCAWPSVGTICRHARLSRRQVQYSLQALEQAGAIVRVGESRARTAIWNIVLQERLPIAQGAHDLHGADSAPVQSAAPGGAEVAPEPSVEPSRTTPPNPPKGGTGNRSRRRGRGTAGGFDPGEPLDDFTRAAYRRIGVHLPDGATQADAEKASAA